MKSLSMIVEAADAGAVNDYLEQLGRGPDCLAVPLSPDGEAPATHFGCHTYDDELLIWLADAPAVHRLAVDDRNSVQNFAALAAGLGLQIIPAAEPA